MLRQGKERIGGEGVVVELRAAPLAEGAFGRLHRDKGGYAAPDGRGLRLRCLPLQRHDGQRRQGRPVGIVAPRAGGAPCTVRLLLGGNPERRLATLAHEALPVGVGRGLTPVLVARDDQHDATQHHQQRGGPGQAEDEAHARARRPCAGECLHNAFRQAG